MSLQLFQPILNEQNQRSNKNPPYLVNLFLFNQTKTCIKSQNQQVHQTSRYFQQQCPLIGKKINQEDSSVSGYQSIHEDDIPQIQSPALHKLVSLPAPLPKHSTRKASLNGTSTTALEIVQQNLQKLTLIKTQQIWLFLSKPYKNQQSDDKISKSIKEISSLKKVRQNQAGWNVLVRKQDAKQLIINGVKVNNVVLKFYISNINFPNRTDNYKLKGSEKSKQFDQKKESSVKKKAPSYDSKNTKPKKYQQKKGKNQKQIHSQLLPKHLAAGQNQETQISQMFENSLKIENNKVQTQVQNNVYNQQKPGQIQINNLASSEQILKGLQRENWKATSQQQKPKTKENEIKQQSSQSKVRQKSPQQQNQVNGRVKISEQYQQYDSQESLQRMKKALRRKNRKLNKKSNPLSQSKSIDLNNPYAFLN